MDTSSYTMRELVASALNNAPSLRALGIPVNAVWDADTVEGPQENEFPFIVLRWYDSIDSLGALWRQPLDAWVYYQGSDRTPAQKIVWEIVKVLTSLEPQKKLEGALVEIESIGAAADMRDEVFDALVVPWRFRVVGSGP